MLGTRAETFVPVEEGHSNPAPEAEIPDVAGGWLANLRLCATPTKRRAVCA